MIEFLAGETRRLYCEECCTEFELTYEPKATTPKEKKGIAPKAATVCPFCEGDLCAEDDGDE